MNEKENKTEGVTIGCPLTKLSMSGAKLNLLDSEKGKKKAVLRFPKR